MPVVLLTDLGPSGPAGCFAAALDANSRAESIGERTLVVSPSRSWSSFRMAAASADGFALSAAVGTATAGLEPDVAVDQPELEFGRPRRRPTKPPARDRTSLPKSRSLTAPNLRSDPLTPYRPSIGCAILTVLVSLSFQGCRRVAQLVERLPDTEEVSGSSPPAPTNCLLDQPHHSPSRCPCLRRR